RQLSRRGDGAGRSDEHPPPREGAFLRGGASPRAASRRALREAEDACASRPRRQARRRLERSGDFGFRAGGVGASRPAVPRGGAGRLTRTWKDGIAKVPAFLEDEAYLAHALLDLADADRDRRGEWVLAAEKTVAGFARFKSEGSALLTL